MWRTGSQNSENHTENHVVEEIQLERFILFSPIHFECTFNQDTDLTREKRQITQRNAYKGKNSKFWLYLLEVK